MCLRLSGDNRKFFFSMVWIIKQPDSDIGIKLLNLRLPFKFEIETPFPTSVFSAVLFRMPYSNIV